MKPDRKRAAAKTALVLVCLLFLGACSVLRIDVDVYNGPLANHEEVQVEQLAAMVMAAKPLLVQLRDTLQWDSVCKNDDPTYLDCLTRHKRNLSRTDRDCADIAGVLRSTNPKRNSSHTCRLNYPASRVNDLLSLYVDRDQHIQFTAVDPASQDISFPEVKELIITFTTNLRRLDNSLSSSERREAKATIEKAAGAIIASF